MSTEVTVTNNDENSINLEISTYEFEVYIEMNQSNEAALAVHDKRIEAHSNVIGPIAQNLSEVTIDLSTRAHIVDMTTALETKANITNTYTKSEIETKLATKLSAADSAVTKQGNEFNGANQLVQLTSNGRLPQLDGSLLSGTNSNLQVNNLGTITCTPILSINKKNIGFVNANITLSLPTIGFVSNSENKLIFEFTLSNGCTVVLPTGLKWSGGKVPTIFSSVSGVRNNLEFITNDSGATWEAEYTVFGGVETTFVQPVLSADGTLGGSNFAVYASNPAAGYPLYRAFDNNNSTESSNNYPSYLLFYNPLPLKLSQLDIVNQSSGSYGINNYTLYGSNDNAVFTTLVTGANTNNTAFGAWTIVVPAIVQDFYKYYKLFVASGLNTSGYCLMQMNIQAKYISI